MDSLPPAIRASARRLRSRGWAYGEIARELEVAPATARRWTLDIRLTPEQLSAIDGRRASAAKAASHSMAARCRRERLAWQEEGRCRAREGDLLHQAGCLLYWGEGSKDRNTLCLVNSDLDLVRLFRRFLADCLDVATARMTIRLNIYTGNGLSIRQVEDRWLQALDLPRSCLRKHYVNRRPAPSSGAKYNKLPYGVCSLSVLRSTSLVQHIYGAIREYGDLEEPRWLD